MKVRASAAFLLLNFCIKLFILLILLIKQKKKNKCNKFYKKVTNNNINIMCAPAPCLFIVVFNKKKTIIIKINVFST